MTFRCVLYPQGSSCFDRALVAQGQFPEFCSVVEKSCPGERLVFVYLTSPLCMIAPTCGTAKQGLTSTLVLQRFKATSTRKIWMLMLMLMLMMMMILLKEERKKEDRKKVSKIRVETTCLYPRATYRMYIPRITVQAEYYYQS